MAGCYECNFCGRCTMGEMPLGNLVLACMNCGKAVEPGELSKTCTECGSANLKYVSESRLQEEQQGR